MTYQTVSRETSGICADLDRLPTRDQWDKIVVHYNGPAVRSLVLDGNRNSERAFLRAVEEDQQARNYTVFAYNEAIGNSGDLYEARGNRRAAAHLGDLDRDGIAENDEGYAIFMMVGEDQRPSDEALATLDARIAELGLPAYGHREVHELGQDGTATSCPGDFLAAWVKDRRTSGAAPSPTAPAGSSTARPAPAPSATASEEFDVTTLPLSRRGDNGKAVKAVQGLLNADGRFRTRVDGAFGPLTESCVTRFQKAVGAQVDGIVGPETWGHLLDLEG